MRWGKLPPVGRLTQEASWLRVCWLSTYVPQLDPIELLWNYVRRHVMHTRLFAPITALVTAVEEFWAVESALA